MFLNQKTSVFIVPKLMTLKHKHVETNHEIKLTSLAGKQRAGIAKLTYLYILLRRKQLKIL